MTEKEFQTILSLANTYITKSKTRSVFAEDAIGEAYIQFSQKNTPFSIDNFFEIVRSVINKMRRDSEVIIDSNSISNKISDKFFLSKSDNIIHQDLVCTKCKKVLHESQFYRQFFSNNGKIFVKSYCKECTKKSFRLYYQKNSRNILSKKKIHYSKNKESVIQRALIWKKNNLERKREIDREYRKRNRDKINEKQRARRHALA